MTAQENMLLGIAILAAVFVAVLLVRKLFRKKPTPSDFAVGLSRSLTRNADDWDYDLKELWLINRVASLALCLQPSHWGNVDMLQAPNSGTATIEKLAGFDKTLVEEAYGEWKKITALPRKQIAERRKRDAMAVLGA